MSTPHEELALELLVNNEVCIAYTMLHLGFKESDSIMGILKKIGNMFFVKDENDELITFDVKDVGKVFKEDNIPTIEITL